LQEFFSEVWRILTQQPRILSIAFPEEAGRVFTKSMAKTLDSAILHPVLKDRALERKVIKNRVFSGEFSKKGSEESSEGVRAWASESGFYFLCCFS
jgi:hypothetical protein